MDIIKKQVDEFIGNELRTYAIYDNSRSLPSVVDGLKTAHRKIIYTVFETIKNNVEVKTASLGASASNLTHYKHGEVSITEAVITLCQDYAGANNYPLLQKKGQFGTAQDYTTSSPRYIFIKRDEKLNDMFDTDDREIVNYQHFDGDQIEPDFYLPKLPLVIINGSVGIGNGYKTNITQRDTRAVAKYIADKVEKGEADKDLLMPSYNGFTGTIDKVSDNSFIINGRLERVNTTTTIIKDLPPTSAYQYETYKSKVLLPLLLNNKSGLNDIENESTEGNWHIVLKHTREFANCTDEQLLDKLKMSAKLTETVIVWGFDGRLKIFDNVYDLVDYWLEHRLIWIEKRKEHMLSKLKSKQEWYDSLLLLIEHWLANPNITQLKRDVLTAQLKTVVDNDEHISKFLEQNILSLTKERVEKLRNEIKLMVKEYKTLKAKKVEQIYLDDLVNFK